MKLRKLALQMINMSKPNTWSLEGLIYAFCVWTQDTQPIASANISSMPVFLPQNRNMNWRDFIRSILEVVLSWQGNLFIKERLWHVDVRWQILHSAHMDPLLLCSFHKQGRITPLSFIHVEVWYDQVNRRLSIWCVCWLASPPTATPLRNMLIWVAPMLPRTVGSHSFQSDCGCIVMKSLLMGIFSYVSWLPLDNNPKH